MFLQRLAIKNWRALGKLELDLDPGLNVLHGPNESGKSSLHEALRSAFLVRSRGKGSPTAAKPWRAAGATHVEVAFQHHGESWRLIKVFFANGSQLYRGDTLVAKDDAVQTWLDENLADRGMAALLSVQGDIKLADVPAAMRPHLVAAETVTPGVGWLEEQLRDHYELFWTPKSGSAKKSLSDLRKALLEQEKVVADIQEERKQAARSAQEMHSLQQECAQGRESQASLQADLERQRPRLSAWESYRRQQAELAGWQQQDKTLESWLQRWETGAARAQQLEPLLADWRSRRAALEGQVEPDRGEVERLRLRLQYAEARQQIALREELATLSPPAREDVQRLEGLQNRLRGAEQALEMGAWEAELEAVGDISATLDGRPVSLAAGHKQSWKTAQGFTLEIGGARLSLRAGGQAAREVEDCRRELEGRSPAEARAKLEQGQAIQARLKGSAPDLEALRARYPDWGEVDALSDLDAELAHLPSRIAAAEAEWKEAHERHLASQKQLQELLRENPEVEMRNTRQTLEALKEEMGEVESVRQSRVALKDKIAATSVAVPDGEEVSAEAIQALEARFQEDQRELGERQTRLDRLIGGVKDQKDLYTRLCQAEERQAQLARQLREMEATANGARLIWEGFQAARQTLEADIVAPLRQRLGLRLANLTGARYRQVRMESDFKAESLVNAEEQLAPVIDLSYGTREQLAFLSRVCLAEMLSEKERSLVLFDDSLVHTDARRLKLACKLLEEAAQTSQVILLTCHAERFLPNLGKANVTDLTE